MFLSALEVIHQRKIAYRDLKPENLVLNQDGYCIVCDFGISKKCDKGQTWTSCGTADYVAPEIMLGKGHDWGVDYWGLGVLLYELMHGVPPFYADDPMDTSYKIIAGSFSIPPNFSEALADLIQKLLCCEQWKRLGRTAGGPAEIGKHYWFSGFDWTALVKMEMEVPYKPNCPDNLEALGKPDCGGSSAPVSDWNPEFD